MLDYLGLMLFSAGLSGCCCCCSTLKSCPTLCDPMDCGMPGFPVLHYFPESAQTHVLCGEGNGNPLQYSCLENPVDREAWWAAIYGVTQIQTRLKRLSSSSSSMSIELIILSHHLILCHLFSSCPQSFPESGSFPISWSFTSGGQSTGVSASAAVLPMNIWG